MTGNFIFHIICVSATLQTTSESLLLAYRSYAIDIACIKYSFLLNVGISKSFFNDFALLISLFNVVTIVSLGQP